MMQESGIIERKIKVGVYNHISLHGWRWFLPDVNFYRWMSDYLAFNPESGMVHEFEVSLTKQEFLKDRRKHKHSAFKSGNGHIERIPNFFTFVLPPGVYWKYDIPAYAGIMEWRQGRNGSAGIKTIRRPKKLTDLITCDGDYDYLIEQANEKLIKAWVGQV